MLCRRSLSPLLIGVLLPFAAADFNPNITNGKCYYAAGQILDPRFVPCGNADGGHLPCCQSLDNCLSSLACYNPSTGTTYLAGCTDETYGDVLCPNKDPYSTHDWAGLVDCDDNLSIWVACDDNSPTVTHGSPCSCSTVPSSEVAFTDAPTLTNIMSLPYSTGGSVSWWTYSSSFNGQMLSSEFSAAYYSSLAGRDPAPSLDSPPTSAPTAPSSSKASSLLSSSPSPTPGSTTSSITSAAPTPTGSSTSPAERIGIGVGVAGGVLVLGVLLAMTLFCLRRKQKHTKLSQEDHEEKTNSEIGSPARESSHKPGGTEEDIRSPAWSGHKSELSADNETMVSSPAPTQSQWGSISARVSRSDLNSEASRPALRAPQRASELSGQGIYEMPA